MDTKCSSPSCGEAAPLICSGCRTVRYCSKDHQKAHWKEHLNNCKAFKEEWDNQIGKHLVASRNLKPGDIILQESPLVIGFEEQQGKSKLVCVGCFSFLTDRGRKKCPECNWPMCGDKHCWADGSPHSQGECSLLKAAGTRVTVNVAKSNFNEVHYSILILRCLSLRDRDMKKWKKLMELKDCKSVAKQNGLVGVDEAAIVQLVSDWMPASAIVSKETIIKLCRVFFVNSLSLQPVPGHRPFGLRAVYSVGSLIEHSCLANATSTCTKDCQLVVRAAVPIPKGARIKLNNRTYPLYHTQKRRENLLKFQFLSCRCERCKDPTEFGSFTSGILCPDCPKKGTLLPEDPLDEDSDWVCNKCSGKKTVIGFVADLLDEVEEAFDGLNRQSIGDCERFVRKFSKVLHPHHSHLSVVKIMLCKLYGGNYPEKLESCAMQLLEIANIVAPGLSELRGTFLYHIFYVMKTKIMDPKCNYDVTQIKALKNIMEELITIMSFEPEETQEGQLCKQMKKTIKSSIFQQIK